MYIEDIIDSLMFSPVKLNRFDQKIIDSFGNQIMMGTGFTEKQSILAVKILGRYSDQISLHLKNNINTFLENPTYRYKIRKTVTTRSIKIIDNSVIEVKFPFDENFVAEIRKYKSNHSARSGNIVWDKENTSWMFTLNESNIQFITNLCNPNDFELNEWNSIGSDIKINLCNPHTLAFPPDYLDYCARHQITPGIDTWPLGNLVDYKNTMPKARNIMNKNIQISNNSLSFSIV